MGRGARKPGESRLRDPEQSGNGTWGAARASAVVGSEAGVTRPRRGVPGEGAAGGPGARHGQVCVLLSAAGGGEGASREKLRLREGERDGRPALEEARKLGRGARAWWGMAGRGFATPDVLAAKASPAINLLLCGLHKKS